MPDDIYFCAKCLAQLPLVNSEDESCPKCDTPICCEKDFLTEVQWGARVAEDWRLEREAIACGLIIPKTGEASP